MAFPSSHNSAHPSTQARSNPGHGSAPSRHPASRSSAEGEHQLEKLEFALAVALTRGDLDRSRQLRDMIAALGGNQEEPGT